MMGSNSLFKIGENYLKIIEEIETNDGEITPEIEQQLVINKEELTVKSENYVAIIKQNKMFINAIDEEIQRLTKLKKRSENFDNKLKENLKVAMITFGFKKIPLEIGSISLRETDKVEIEDENDIQMEYCKITTSINSEIVDLDFINKISKELQFSEKDSY